MNTSSTEQPGTAEQTKAKRTRRAEPINTHTARNGTVTYWFQLDVGTKPDGSRDRRKFTYPTKAGCPESPAPHQLRGRSGHLQQADRDHRR